MTAGSQRAFWKRIAAVAAAAVLLPAGSLVLVMVMWVGAIEGQWPDPSVQDGDPCCGYPDTWGQVGGGYAFTLAGGMVVFVLLWATIALVRWATTHWAPGRRGWLIAAAAGAVVSSLGFALSLALSLSSRR